MAAYFFDSQIKRWLIQFARIFSNWECTKGYDANGNPIIIRIPIMYGDQSRQVSTIIANNSPSNLPSAPIITYYISGFEYDQNRTQEPYFQDKTAVRQRALNPLTNEYDTTQGNAFTVERIMPVPYTLKIKLDFWSTNYQQKTEFIEQLGTLFNPSMELQSTDNFIDWTSLSVVYQNGIQWTSRSIPMGTGNPIDILSWDFYIPVWLSSPVKITKLNIIHKIIASIFKGKYREDIQDDDLLLGTRQKITPYGYKILLLDGALQILPANQPFYPPNTDLDPPQPPNTSLYWHAVLNPYGVIREGISMIALENPYMETEIMGTIAYNPVDDRLLIYNIDPDTLPQNTLPPVDSVIDPATKYPGNGLPLSANGQRYLILEDIPEQTLVAGPASVGSAWPGLTAGAPANSIIEFDGTDWVISFDPRLLTDAQFVTNLTTNIQYRFVSGQGWLKSWEGWYDQGSWRLII